MGIVTFGQLKLNVENVPDGHTIVSDSEYARYKQSTDALFMLKSKIPVGVPEDKLAEIIEKGQRYDGIAQELVTVKTTATDLSGKLGKFSNMPQDFTVEQWQKDRTTEKNVIRAGKMADVEKQALATIEREHKVKVKVDSRFLPDLSTFDPDSKTAVQDYILILDKADTAQTEFMKNQLGGQFPVSSASPTQPVVAGQPKTGPADNVSDGAIQVQSFLKK